MKVDPMGNLIGLDYSAVQATMEMFQISSDLQKNVFSQVLKCFYWFTEATKDSKPKEAE